MKHLLMLCHSTDSWFSAYPDLAIVQLDDDCVKELRFRKGFLDYAEKPAGLFGMSFFDNRIVFLKELWKDHWKKMEALAGHMEKHDSWCLLERLPKWIVSAKMVSPEACQMRVSPAGSIVWIGNMSGFPAFTTPMLSLYDRIEPLHVSQVLEKAGFVYEFRNNKSCYVRGEVCLSGFEGKAFPGSLYQPVLATVNGYLAPYSSIKVWLEQDYYVGGGNEHDT